MTAQIIDFFEAKKRLRPIDLSTEIHKLAHRHLVLPISQSALDDMSDEELDAYIDRMFGRSRALEEWAKAHKAFNDCLADNLRAYDPATDKPNVPYAPDWSGWEPPHND